jgi:hypothetical protein
VHPSESWPEEDGRNTKNNQAEHLPREWACCQGDRHAFSFFPSQNLLANDGPVMAYFRAVVKRRSYDDTRLPKLEQASTTMNQSLQSGREDHGALETKR